MAKNPEKKICYICYRRFPDTNFEHYSKAVSDEGYSVTILSFQDKDQKKSEKLDNRKIIRIPLPIGVKARKRALIFILRTVKILNKKNFSIVHIHHTCSYFLLIKILTFRKAKYIFHTTSYPISASKFGAYKKMLAHFIQCLFVNKIIVQSDELKKELIGIRALKRSIVVPVGFNKNYLYPIGKKKRNHLRKLLKIRENTIALVYCGAISRLRQLDRLLEGFRKVHMIFPDVMLLMIGDGDAVKDLKEYAIALEISNRTIFTGRIAHHEVVNYIAIADIGISYIPINDNYNFNPPLKTFEYLACGLPTIGTSTESNRKIIKDGFNGIIVGDHPAHISTAIIKLLKDKKKQDLLAANARKSIMSFDFEHITKTKLIPLYDDLLKVH